MFGYLSPFSRYSYLKFRDLENVGHVMMDSIRSGTIRLQIPDFLSDVIVMFEFLEHLLVKRANWKV